MAMVRGLPSRSQSIQLISSVGLQILSCAHSLAAPVRLAPHVRVGTQILTNLPMFDRAMEGDIVRKKFQTIVWLFKCCFDFVP